MKTVDTRFWNHRATLPQVGTLVVSRGIPALLLAPVGDEEEARRIATGLARGLRRSYAPVGAPHSG